MSKSIDCAKACIVWFRNDLRLYDNYVLHTPEFKQSSSLVGVYCFDDRFENRFTRSFRAEACADLAIKFQEAFSAPLLCFNRKPEDVLPELISKFGSSGNVICSTESASFERKVNKRVSGRIRQYDWTLKETWNYSLHHPSDLPFNVYEGNIPELFTKFRNKIEDLKLRVRAPVGIPTTSASNTGLNIQELQSLAGFVPLSSLPTIDVKRYRKPLAESTNIPKQALSFQGGETSATLRLEDFVRIGLSSYKSTRNQSIGWSYSSKMSPYLAAGCISPRKIRHRIREFEEENEETVHTYWITFELLWRDYMRFLSLKHGDNIFRESGPEGKIPNGLKWFSKGKETERRLSAWKRGQTGVPWVDAHMRELLHTGFISNRGRQNVASFLIHNLQIDWRLGAKHFEDYLIDHDVSANWCNWNTLAGVGGSRPSRFNMDKQARQHDPKGVHSKLWLVELANVPGSKVHDLANRVSGYKSISQMFMQNSTDKDMEESKSLNENSAYPLPLIHIPRFTQNEKGWRNKSRVHRGRKKVFHTT